MPLVCDSRTDDATPADRDWYDARGALVPPEEFVSVESRRTLE